MKKLVVLLISFLLAPLVFAQYNDTLPSYLADLRDAAYGQGAEAAELLSNYNAAVTGISKDYDDVAELNYLAQCEYLTGIGYNIMGDEDNATVHFQKGYDIAQKSLDIKETAEGWATQSDNLGGLCGTKGASYQLLHGYDVIKFSNNALELDPRNAGAQYMIAASWIYAPAIHRNFNTGIDYLNTMLTKSDMDKHDYFDACTAMAYCYLQKKDIDNAKQWLAKAQALYPQNAVVKELEKEIK
ncbi:MAG: hypothetical protein LBM77_11240 [Spirochaetaceae bacterium]|nr:hypothetical protein [Spirochaetaceae bacterium]